MCFSISLIVWVIQAVGYLDIVIEDGHSFYIYFSYVVLNFPKIIHRILPFVFFISLFYQISQYEIKNELLVFWTNGINKIQFINVIIFYSIFITLFQILLGSFISPIGQNEARSFIRKSNIDFFPSLIKEGKFIDTVKNLTIFIESKNEFGQYKNIFLNDTSGKNKKDGKDKSQIIFAKKGILVFNGKNRYFELLDGKVINKDNGRITNFAFDKIDFNISKYASKSITHRKVQETPSSELFNCLYYAYHKKIEQFASEYLTCVPSSLKNIQQEFFKRFYKPIYFPLLALISCLLIFKSKESIDYNKFKFYLFSFIFFIIVISEISLRYSTSSTIGLLFFIFFPLLSFFTIYFSLITKLNIKFKI